MVALGRRGPAPLAPRSRSRRRDRRPSRRRAARRRRAASRPSRRRRSRARSAPTAPSDPGPSSLSGRPGPAPPGPCSWARGAPTRPCPSARTRPSQCPRTRRRRALGTPATGAPARRTPRAREDVLRRAEEGRGRGRDVRVRDRVRLVEGALVEGRREERGPGVRAVRAPAHGRDAGFRERGGQPRAPAPVAEDGLDVAAVRRDQRHHFFRRHHRLLRVLQVEFGGVAGDVEPDARPRAAGEVVAPPRRRPLEGLAERLQGHALDDARGRLAGARAHGVQFPIEIGQVVRTAPHDQNDARPRHVEGLDVARAEVADLVRRPELLVEAAVHLLEGLVDSRGFAPAAQRAAEAPRQFASIVRGERDAQRERGPHGDAPRDEARAAADDAERAGELRAHARLVVWFVSLSLVVMGVLGLPRVLSGALLCSRTLTRFGGGSGATRSAGGAALARAWRGRLPSALANLPS